MNVQCHRELWTWTQWIWIHFILWNWFLVNIFVISTRIASLFYCNYNCTWTQIAFWWARELSNLFKHSLYKKLDLSIYWFIIADKQPIQHLLFNRCFKNTVDLFIHIARIPIGDSPRVHPNILKCLLHSPVAKGYRLVVIASRAMACKTPTYYLILYPLAYARGCVILRSHILILLLLILLIFHHIHS